VGYLGSKAASGAFQAIIAIMPPHDTYVELFVGSGAVLRRKPPAMRSIAVDLDRSVLRSLPPSTMTVCGEAIAYLDTGDYPRSTRTLIYADPPYLHSTRTSRHRYQYEMTDLQHRCLLRRLKQSRAHVILSGYPSALYDAMLTGWRVIEFQAMTRGGPRTEKLWFNFEPDRVYWSTYAGRNFTDRQRIKRKAARWAAHYGRLPPGERLAILAALLTSTITGGVSARGTSRALQMPPTSRAAK
jgi:hypothetical protein